MIENYPKYPVELIYIPDFGMIYARASDSNRARGAASDYMGRGAVSEKNTPRGIASESNSLDLASVIFQNGDEYDSKSGRGSGFAHDNFITMSISCTT